MSEQTYKGKLVGSIGRVALNVKASNAFPVIGEEVTLTALTRWAQRVQFGLLPAVGGNASVDDVRNTSQETVSALTVEGAGDLGQTVRALNYEADGTTPKFSMDKQRFLYAMAPQELPYFDVSASEVVRVGEDGYIKIYPENGYDTSRGNTITVRIYRENETGAPVKIMTFDTGNPGPAVWASSIFTFDKASDRGIYDVEVDATDALTGVTLTKRINKLITVTPRLAARPAEDQEPFGVITGDKGTQIKMYKTGANDLYCTFEVPNLTYYEWICIGDIPEGYDAYTLVLSKPAVADDNCNSRIWLSGKDNGTNVNGTPQFSRENPLVITIDSDVPVEFHGCSYNTWNYSHNVRNTVLDGRGYHNLHNGIKFNKNPVTLSQPTTAMMILNGTSDFEAFEVEITDVSFAGIMTKTDPGEDSPWYWQDNFVEDNFRWHHIYTHDTYCEGCYIGYFSTGYKEVVYSGHTVSFKNAKGENVTYTSGTSYRMYPHILTNLRFYRNTYERTGYDGVQIGNSFGEVCYNRLDGCAWRRESSQNTGMSIQGFSGKCYNNFIYDTHGASLQIGPIGDIELFNNIIYTENGGSIQFLFSDKNKWQDPTDGGDGTVNDSIRMVFHNNVIAANGVTANGRNTIQMRGVYMYDNLLVNNGVLFSNMTGETLEVWKSRTVNNIEFKFSDLHGKAMEYKIASYEDGDFRIAFDSPLATAGLGTSFTFDYRGYKNWFAGGQSPIGPFMGKYRNPAVVSANLLFASMKIDAGAAETSNRTVSVSYSYEGRATHYRIGEAADLSDADWEVIAASPVGYTFKDTEYGTKTLYMQLKNNVETSAVLHGSINYAAPPYVPLVLNSVTINDGAAGTYSREVSVALGYTEGSTTAVSYRAAESVAALDAVEWQPLSNPFTYMMSDMYGAKTIYVQLKDSDGNVTDAKGDGISYEKTPQEVTVVAIQWPNGYDEENKINKGISSSNTSPNVLKSNLGNVFGKSYRLTLSIVSYSEETSGAVTGDDSFDYPDIYMKRNQQMRIYSSGTAQYQYKFTSIAPGRYRVRLFASTIFDNDTATDKRYYRMYTGYGTDNQVQYDFPQVSDIKDNISEWMVQEVTVTDDGELVLEFGLEGKGISALGIIEFTKVVPVAGLAGISKIYEKGTRMKFAGNFLPEDCTETEMAWSIEPATRNASISQGGLLTVNPTAVVEERITVKAVSRYDSALEASCPVTILYHEPVTGLAIVGETNPQGKRATYTCAYTPELTSEKSVVWSIVSQDAGMDAAIDTHGVLTYGASGNVTIKVASAINPSVSATLDVSATYMDIERVDFFVTANTNALYFDTGIIPTLDTKAQITVLPASTSVNADLMGSRNDANDGAKLYMYLGGTSHSGGFGDMATGNVPHGFGLTRPWVFTIDKDSYNVTCGESSSDKAVGATSFGTSRLSMYLLRFNTPQSRSVTFNGKFYGAKVWQGDVLVGDFIPCLHSSIPSVYNAVDGSYHDNLGNGEGVTWQ